MSWRTAGAKNTGPFFASAETIVFAPSERSQNGVQQTSPDMLVAPIPTRPRALIVIVDITKNTTGAGSVQLDIKMRDPASGKYLTLLSSAALSALATTRLRISPELSASANLVAQDLVPETLQFVASGNGSPITYSVGAVLCG